jgi:urease accessory protein UreE
MLCDRVLGNVGRDDDARFAGKARDVLELPWRECAHRAVRGVTRGGLRVGVLLPLGQCVGHGDIVFEDESSYVEVYVLPCAVLVADFCDTACMANAALELGNLHVPVQVLAELQLGVLPDGPARAVMTRYAASSCVETRRFAPLRATVTGGDVGIAETFQVRRAPAS